VARARNIKPSFFTNEDLVELPFEERLLFIGLWTLADREGRLEDRPKRIKMAVFPADNVDVDASLARLAKSRFITRYEARGIACIQVLNFAKHQNPHVREAASELPSIGENETSTVPAQCQHSASPADSLNPYSLNPESGEQASESLNRSSATLAPIALASADPSPEVEPTEVGLIAKRLRSAGIEGVNTHDPRLHALLQAGISADELCGIAEEPKSRGKGMAWVLATAEGRRRDAAKVRPLPRASPTLADRNRQAADEAKRMIFGEG
jgi:hypothetical protein